MAQHEAKAHFFHVLPQEGNAAEITELLRKFAKKKKPLDLIRTAREVQVCEPRWHKVGQDEVFTATAFWVRTTALPALVGAGDPRQLEIPADTGLGEPMCFAYDPVQAIAAVTAAPQGPGPSVIASFLGEIGFPHKVVIEPVIRADILEALQKKKYVASFAYKLKGIHNSRKLSTAGLPVEKTIELADTVGGNDVGVEISVGVEKQGLAVEIVKATARRLYELQGTQVVGLKVRGAEVLGQKCETLDLIKARLEAKVSVTDASRELDRKGLQLELVRVLKEVVPGSRKQRPSAT
jgi:hypothetical protein